MPTMMCKACHQFMDKRELRRNLCRRCSAVAEAERGSRRERGIGPNHESLARDLKANPRDHVCHACGGQGTEADPLTVGHIIPRIRCLAIGKDPDDVGNLQPEHRSCNLSRSNER